MVLVIVLFIVVILAIVVVHIQLNKIEKKNFNNGICPKCGEPLVFFATETTNGDRGYECLHCPYVTWVNHFSLVDKDFRNRIR